MIKKKLFLSRQIAILCASMMAAPVVAEPYFKPSTSSLQAAPMAMPMMPPPQQPYSQGYQAHPQQMHSHQYAYPPAGQTQMPAQPGPGVYVVRSVAMPAMVKLGGTVIPNRDVTLSAQIPGRIEFIAGREGDAVTQGQVLVVIDDDDLLAKRRQALAQLNNAESAIRNAQVQYSRELISPQSRNINRMPGMGMPSLFDQFFTRNFGSMMGYGNPSMDRHADLYSRSTAVNQAQARSLQARSKLEEVDARLRDTRAVAPFSGLIVKKLVEVGDTVQPGMPLMKFADTNALQLKVDVPARLMPGIRLDMQVSARLDVGDQIVQAKVSQIFPMADVQRHTVTVKFDLPESAQGGPGMYAEVILPDVNSPVNSTIYIPKTAVQRKGSLPAVYRLNNDNKAELRYIRVGEEVGQSVKVLSGLNNNERILMNPPRNIKAGWSPNQNKK